MSHATASVPAEVVDASGKCSHADQVCVNERPAAGKILGCEECLKNHTKFVHLRMCRKCGHIGCCDSSEHQHARKHAETCKHHVIQSLEPGENWNFDFTTNTMVPIRAAKTMPGPTTKSKSWLAHMEEGW
jgi:hypothetical protein